MYRPLGPYAVAATVGAALGFLSIVVDTMMPGSPFDALTKGGAHADVATAWVIVAASVVELVTFLAWCWRAASNARAFGGEGLVFTPLTTIGWLFLPIVNLYMPYRALREAWKASAPGASASSWRDAKPPALLLAWWLSFWASILVGDDDPTPLGWAGVAVTLASSALFVALAFAFARRQAACAAYAR